jgi:hypothetical protein
MFSEIHYYVKTAEGNDIYLGCVGTGFHPEMLNNAGFHDYLASRYPQLSSLNRFTAEDNATVKISMRASSKTVVVITCYLAKANHPELQYTYLGLNPSNKRLGCKRKAHCWDLYIGAHFVDPEINLALLCNEFRKKEDSIPDRYFVRFMMHMDERWLPPYIYGFFVPFQDLTIAKEVADTCPEDCYLLEYSDTCSSYFFTVKKEKYNSEEQIVPGDLIMLDS